MKKNRMLMIRMDDITPDMNWDKFDRIRQIFDKYSICPLLGVVPDSKDSDLRYDEPRTDFWEVIRTLQKKGWAIAQHGTNHSYATTNSGLLKINPFSEFAGLPYEEQLENLQRGKKTLEEKGISSCIFMAPGHTYDKNTLKALVACGFTCVTDGLYKKPYISYELLFVPCRLREYRKVNGIDTICLHSNLMSDTDINELEAFCENNYENIIPFIPEKIATYAIKRTIFVLIGERLSLFIRNLKKKVARSERLVWYMQCTYDKNSKKKLVKRIFCLPMLIIGGKGSRKK